MKIKSAFVLFWTAVTTQFAIAQAPLPNNQEKVSAAITSFFKLDRENIHLHLNKTQYLNSDKIWFKGYITEKKTNLPYEPTSNVHVNLLDEKGVKIRSFLFYAENSTFEGNIPLLPTYKTGTYYLQVYTNYMNNFSEDESSVYQIAVLNPSENKKVRAKEINYNSLSMTFSPESGVLLEGVTNTVAIQVKDCNNNGVAVKDGFITDSKGTVITTFTTNTLGYGKFDLLINQNETYKVSIKPTDKTIEQLLPQPALSGITFSVNSYTFADKVILKIKTNPRTLAAIGSKKYSLVIQKNNSATYSEFSFDNKPEKVISLPSESFSSGLNTIHLLDENLARIGERIVYKPLYSNSKIDLKLAGVKSDSIRIKGLTDLKLAELSISIVPADALIDNSAQNIYSKKLFGDLKESIPDAAYFVNDFSKKKHFELDNILMTSQSKYSWRAIATTEPKQNFEFDNGLHIRGTLNTVLKNKDQYKVNMSSVVLGFNEFTSIDDANEFHFKNLFLTDSSKVFFSLLNKRAAMDEMKMAASVLNNKRTFLKSYKPFASTCGSAFETVEKSDDKFFPSIANTTMLDSIIVNGTKKKPELNNGLRFSNSMSKGYKINDRDVTSYRDLLQFIASHGYDVSTEGGSVNIIGRVSTSFLGTKSPAIFIDDIPVPDFNMLLNYSLLYIDEIYINKRGFGGGLNASNGVIRIYTKKGMDMVRNNLKIKSGSLVIDGGFQPYSKFVTPKYTSFRDAGFQNYGTINWIPKTMTDAEGTFSFTLPNLYQPQVKVIIEGISSDGQVISEIKTIEISQ